MGGTLSLEQQAHDGLLSSQEKRSAILTFIDKVGDTPQILRKLHIKTTKKTCLSILDYLSSILDDGTSQSYIDIVNIMRVLQRLLQLEGFYVNMIKMESFAPILRALSITNDDVVEETLKVIHLMITCQVIVRVQPVCGGKDLQHDSSSTAAPKTSKNDLKLADLESEMKRLLYNDHLAQALSDLFDRYYSSTFRTEQTLRILTQVMRAFHLQMVHTINTSTYKQVLACINALSNTHECIIELTIDQDATTREHAARLLISLLLHNSSSETKRLQMYVMEHGKLLWYVYMATRKDDIDSEHHAWDIPNQRDLFARVIAYLSDGNDQVTRVLHRTIPKHLYDNAKAGQIKLEFPVTRAYIYDLTKDEEKTYYSTQFYLYQQDKLKHGDWVSVFEEIHRPHTHPLLVWDKTNKEELVYALLGEIYDYNTQVEVNGTALWDHEGFEVDYTSLNRFLKVGRYYVHLLLPHFEKRMEEEQERQKRAATNKNKLRDKSVPPPNNGSDDDRASMSTVDNGSGPTPRVRQIGMRSRTREGPTAPVVPSKQQHGKQPVDPYNIPPSDLHNLISSCFQRAVVEDDVGWKLGCLRTMSALYANYPRVLQEADMMPYLIWLLTPKTAQGTLLDMNVVVEVINEENNNKSKQQQQQSSSMSPSTTTTKRLTMTPSANTPAMGGDITPSDTDSAPATPAGGLTVPQISINTSDDHSSDHHNPRSSNVSITSPSAIGEHDTDASSTTGGSTTTTNTDRLYNATISQSERLIESQISSAMSSSFNNPFWRDHILKFLNQLFDHTTNINRFVASDGINSLLYYINDVHRVSHTEVVKKYRDQLEIRNPVTIAVLGDEDGDNTTSAPASNAGGSSTSTSLSPPSGQAFPAMPGSTTGSGPTKQPPALPPSIATSRHSTVSNDYPSPLDSTTGGGIPPISTTHATSTSSPSHLGSNAVVGELLKLNRNRRPIYDKIDLLTGIPGPDNHLEVARKCLLLLKKIVKNASRLRKRIFKRRVLVTLVQLLLVEDSDIIHHSLETLMILIDANSHIIPNLARTGVFDFILYAMRYEKKCTDMMAKFIDKYHLKQGSDYISTRGTSIYSSYFPAPLLNISLQPQGGLQLARVIDSTIVNHLLIWDANCKSVLSDTIIDLIEPFVLKLVQCPFTSYRYVTPPQVHYHEIDKELSIGNVYIRLYNQFHSTLNRLIYMQTPSIQQIDHPQLNDPYLLFIALNKEFMHDKYYLHRQLMLVDTFKALGPVVPAKNIKLGGTASSNLGGGVSGGNGPSIYSNFTKEFDHKTRIHWPPVQQQVTGTPTAAVGSGATGSRGSVSSKMGGAYTAAGGTPRASSTLTLPSSSGLGSSTTGSTALVVDTEEDLQRHAFYDGHLIELLQAKATLASILPTNDEIYSYQSTAYLIGLISTIDGPYDATNELLVVSIRLLRALIVPSGSTNPQSFVNHGALTLVAKLIIHIGHTLYDEVGKLFTATTAATAAGAGAATPPPVPRSNPPPVPSTITSSTAAAGGSGSDLPYQDTMELLTQCINIFNGLLANGKNRYHPCTFMYQLSNLLHDTTLCQSFFTITTGILTTASIAGHEWLTSSVLRLLLTLSNIDNELKEFHLVNAPLLDYFDNPQRITPHRYFLQYGIVLDALQLALFHKSSSGAGNGSTDGIILPPHTTSDGVKFSRIHAANLYNQLALPADNDNRLSNQVIVKKLQRTKNGASSTRSILDTSPPRGRTATNSSGSNSSGNVAIATTARGSSAAAAAAAHRTSTIDEDDHQREISLSMIPSDLRHETAMNLESMALLAGGGNGLSAALAVRSGGAGGAGGGKASGLTLVDFGGDTMLQNTLTAMQLYDATCNDMITPTLAYTQTYTTHPYIPCTQTFPNENGQAIRKDAFILLISMCYNELKTFHISPPCIHTNTFYNKDTDSGDRLLLPSNNDNPHESLPNHDHNINYYLYKVVSRLLTPGLMFSLSQLIPMLTVGASGTIGTVATTVATTSTSGSGGSSSDGDSSTASTGGGSDATDQQLTSLITFIESTSETPLLIWNDQTRKDAYDYVQSQLTERQSSKQCEWTWGKQAVQHADEFFNYLLSLAEDNTSAMYLEDVLEASDVQEEQQRMYNARLSRRESARSPPSTASTPASSSSRGATSGSSSIPARKPSSSVVGTKPGASPSSSRNNNPNNNSSTGASPQPPPPLDFPYLAQPVKTEIIVQGIYIRILLQEYEKSDSSTAAAGGGSMSTSSPSSAATPASASYGGKPPQQQPRVVLPSPWTVDSLFEAVSRALHRHGLEAGNPYYANEFHASQNRCLHDGEIQPLHTSITNGGGHYGCLLDHNDQLIDLTSPIRHQLLTPMNMYSTDGEMALRSRIQLLSTVLFHLSRDIQSKLDTFTSNPKSGIMKMLNLIIRGNPYQEHAVLEVLYHLQSSTVNLSIPRLYQPDSKDMPAKTLISTHAHHIVITAVHYLNLILTRETSTSIVPSNAGGSGTTSGAGNASSNKNPSTSPNTVPRPMNNQYISSAPSPSNRSTSLSGGGGTSPTGQRKPSMAPPPHMATIRRNTIDEREAQPLPHPFRPGIMLCLNILQNLIAGEVVLCQGRVLESLWTNGITTTLMKIIMHPTLPQTNSLGVAITNEKLPTMLSLCQHKDEVSATIDQPIANHNHFTTAQRVFAAKLLGTLCSHDIAGPYFLRCLAVLLAPWFQPIIMRSVYYPIQFIEALYTTHNQPDRIWNDQTRGEMLTFIQAECQLVTGHIVNTTKGFAETAYREIRMAECEREIQEYITHSRQNEVNEEEIETYSRLLESQYHDIINETLQKGEVLELVILPQNKFEPFTYPPSTWVERFEQPYLSSQIYVELDEINGVYVVPLLNDSHTFVIDDYGKLMASLVARMSDAMYRVLWLKNHAKETNVAYDEAKEAGYIDDDGKKLTVDIIVNAQVREFEKERELNRLLGVAPAAAANNSTAGSGSKSSNHENSTTMTTTNNSSSSSITTQQTNNTQSTYIYDEDDSDDSDDDDSLDLDELRLEAEILLEDIPTLEDLVQIYKACYQSTQALKVMLRAIQIYTERQPQLLDYVVTEEELAKLGEFLVIESENEWLNYVIEEYVPEYAQFRDENNVNSIIQAILQMLLTFNQPQYISLMYKHKLVRCLLPLLHLHHDHFSMEDLEHPGQTIPATSHRILSLTIELMEMITAHHPHSLPDMINMGAVMYYLNLILQAQYLPQDFVNRLLVGLRLMASYDVRSRIEVLQFLVCEFKDALIGQEQEDFDLLQSMMTEDLSTCILCTRKWGNEHRQILLNLFKAILPTLTTRVMVWTVGSGMVYDRTQVGEVLTPYDDDTMQLLLEDPNYCNDNDAVEEDPNQGEGEGEGEGDDQSPLADGQQGEGDNDEGDAIPNTTNQPATPEAAAETATPPLVPQTKPTPAVPVKPAPAAVPPPKPTPPTPAAPAAVPPPKPTPPTPSPAPAAAPVSAPPVPPPKPPTQQQPPQPPEKPSPPVPPPSTAAAKTTPSQSTTRLSDSDVARRTSVTQQYGAVPKAQPSSKMAALAARFEQQGK